MENADCIVCVFILPSLLVQEFFIVILITQTQSA